MNFSPRIGRIHFRSGGKRSAISHFSFRQSVSIIFRLTFWSPSSRRLSEDLETPSFRAKRYCGVSLRNSRSFAANLLARLPICGEHDDLRSFPHMGNHGTGGGFSLSSRPETQIQGRYHMRSVVVLVCALVATVSSPLDEAKEDYEKEATKLTEAYEYKLALLSERYRKSAEKAKKRATKAGNLDEALKWREWEDTLRDKAHLGKHGNYKNLAREAKVTVSSTGGRSSAAYLNDGSHGEFRVGGGYWWGQKGQKEKAWARFDLKKPSTVRGVRFVFPRNSRWNRGENEPLDYAIVLYSGDRRLKRVSVKDGKHGRMRTIDEKRRVFESTILFAPTKATSVVFECSKTTSRNDGPVVFEFEILGR